MEERIELIEFETLTKQSLVSHIFMEGSDLEMTKITTAILAVTPGGNLGKLRTEVKTTESSMWYKSGGKNRANRVTQEEGNPGNKWCTNCRTGTHETSQCWGSCFSCGAYGHKAVHCKKPKQDLPTSGGAIKKAGVGETPKLTKAAKKRQQKLKKKAEEERKEAEAAKKTLQIFQGSGSSTEEESPKKFSARQAKVGSLVGRSLFKELNEMSLGGRPKTRRCLRSKS